MYRIYTYITVGISAMQIHQNRTEPTCLRAFISSHRMIFKMHSYPQKEEASRQKKIQQKLKISVPKYTY